MKVNVLYDMETNDFDDYLTLCMLAGSPIVNLVGVTLNPGTPEQVALVKKTLQKFKNGKDILVGASNMQNRGNDHVISSIHYKVLGEFGAEKADMYAEQLLHHCLTKYSDLEILTGAYLSNIAAYLKKYTKAVIPSMFIQGGFAGVNIVKELDILPKFKGRKANKTFNFNCDIDAAKYVLNSDRVLERHLVAKNVCHGTVYNEVLHKVLQNAPNKSDGLVQFIAGMDKYREPNGKLKEKMLHDPLMALTFIAKLRGIELCTFKEVKLDCNEKDEWYSELSKGTNTFIAVSCDYNSFYENLIKLNSEV